MVARARVLRGKFRAAAPEGDRLARIPDELFGELRDSRILQALMPHDTEAPPLSLPTYKLAIVELGQGDGGMAWAANLLAQGPWMLKSMFCDSAVREVLATAGGAQIASMVMPQRCTATRVTGGVRIHDGLWRFNSGVYHANWDILGIAIGDGVSMPKEQALVVVPMSDVEILHDWDSIGLRGSGSSSVAVRDVFVPEHRITVGFTKESAAPAAASDDWLYRAEFVPLASSILTFPIIGIARAMLDTYIERTRARPIHYTAYDKQSDAPPTHMQIGRAATAIDTADLIVSDVAAQVEAAARARVTLTVGERMRLRGGSGFAIHLLWEAVNLLAAGAGGSFAMASNPLNRFWRDVRVATLHAGLCAEPAIEAYGRVRCGLDPATTLY